MAIEIDRLRHAWRCAWRGLGAQDHGEAEFQALIARYSEPHRNYHTQQHLADCLTHFEASFDLMARPHESALALFFHDAVYDVAAHDNEARSADLAGEVLSNQGVVPDKVQRVSQLILATRHQSIPADRDERDIVDIDLAILGASPERYADYEQQVRQEYAHVPDARFWQRRGEILQEFLARPAIYATPFFKARLEQSARDNLRRSLTCAAAGGQSVGARS